MYQPELQQLAEIGGHLGLLEVQAVQLCQVGLAVLRAQQRRAARAVLVQRAPHLHMRAAGWGGVQEKASVVTWGGLSHARTAQVCIESTAPTSI